MSTETEMQQQGHSSPTTAKDDRPDSSESDVPQEDLHTSSDAEQLLGESIYFGLRRAAALQARLHEALGDVEEICATADKTRAACSVHEKWQLVLSHMSLFHFGVGCTDRICRMRDQTLHSVPVTWSGLGYYIEMIGRSRVSSLCRIAAERWPLRDVVPEDLTHGMDKDKELSVWLGLESNKLTDTAYMRKFWSVYHSRGSAKRWPPRSEERQGMDCKFVLAIAHWCARCI